MGDLIQDEIPLNADSHHKYYREIVPPGVDDIDEKCCLPTPEEWCRRLGRNYQPIFGFAFADASVFITHFFMLAFGMESMTRSSYANEACESPLKGFLFVQCLFISILHLAVPIINACSEGPRHSRRPPMCQFVLYVLETAWLIVGWYWYLSSNICESTSPFLFYGTGWFATIYSIVVPLEFISFFSSSYSFFRLK